MRAKATTIFKKMFPRSIEIIYPFLSKHILKEDEYYNETAREVYRLFTLLEEREWSNDPRGGRKAMWRKIRDMACMVLEYDDSYCMRFQDLMSEADIDKLKLEIPDEKLDYWRQRKRYDFKGKTTKGSHKEESKQSSTKKKSLFHKLFHSQKKKGIRQSGKSNRCLQTAHLLGASLPEKKDRGAI